MEIPVTCINTDDSRRPAPQNSLLRNREAMAAAHRGTSPAEVSIVVIAWNRLAKTRACIESILAYTEDIDYELLLIDSGSNDGTLNYFRSLSYEKKKIIRITRNLGGGFPFTCLNLTDIGNFMVFVANDIIVTKHWLKNLLACAKSDPRIGMVVPLASNVSNLQSYPLHFRSEQEMHEKAASFNHSDPRKWQERLRLITLSPLFKKEALFAIGFPLLDPGFFHDFGDDDVSFRIRRMGYKAILAGDTWIHHNHQYQQGEDKDPEEFRRSLEEGRKDFREKYFGIDAWDDINNYYQDVIPRLPVTNRPGIPNILGIDSKCGTPILEIKNHLRSQGVMDAELYSFTQDARYVTDLHTISSGSVICDKEEFLSHYYPAGFFDYILLGQPLNQYHEPQKVLQDLFSLIKKNGIIILSLLNTLGIREYLNMHGQRDVFNPCFALNITPEALEDVLKKQGEIFLCSARAGEKSQEQEELLRQMLHITVPEDRINDCLARLYTEEFVFCIKKT